MSEINVETTELDENYKPAIEVENQPDIVDNNPKENTKKTYKIIYRREISYLNREEKKRNKAALAAGLCILGAAASMLFGEIPPSVIIQHELQAIYSWEALGQYLKDLGPLSTSLSVAAAMFIARVYKSSKRIKNIKNDIIILDEMKKEEELKQGGDNAKTI